VLECAGEEEKQTESLIVFVSRKFRIETEDGEAEINCQMETGMKLE